MKMKSLLLTAIFAGWLSIVCAQETKPLHGVADKRHITYAFTNAKLFVDYKTIIDSATLIIKDGMIEAAGKNLTIPTYAVVTNLGGKSIYPSFIDLYTNYGISDQPKAEKGKGPQVVSQTKGAYSWNQALKPEFLAHRFFSIQPEKAADLRKAGFGTVVTFNADGIARGTGSMVTLADENEPEIILVEKVAAFYSFNKGSSGQDYPTSEMGAIALLRQSFLDAEWYKSGGKSKEVNISIQSWIENQSVPQIFESDYKFQALRADKIGDEFGIKYLIKGSGDEYQKLEEIKATQCSFIIPLKYPEGFDVSDPYDALNISLEELKHWEMAPANAATLRNAGIEIAFTASGLKDASMFLDAVRKAILYGLSKEEALKACTATPAMLMGVADRVGSLKKGMVANFIITSGDLFSKENIIFENWVQGNKYVIKKSDIVDIRGNYSLDLNNRKLNLRISGEPFSLKATVIEDSANTKASVAFDNDIVSLKVEVKKDPGKGTYSLNGFRMPSGNIELKGTGSDPEGKQINWSAIWLSPYITEVKVDTAKVEKPSWGKLTYPNKSYGFDSLPSKETVLIKNITVWTCEVEGILTNTDVLITNGKISAIGKNLSQSGAREIDGAGKHLTPGIIDEHSHIAVSREVNECSHSVTAEVRIGDVINPDDINIYRQLSGGVTAAQLLHGSCNAIGGQSAIIKLRWGQSAEKMKLEGAPGFIKFALGENVKQSNWGDDFKIRYPQSRMGVEQVYMDAFTRAREYANTLKKYKSAAKGTPAPRRDLRLETLVEIMNKQRFITCHSYQQGEINMLMKVADSAGFNINTFTHILEGYKVADKMKAHGAGASSFSDWWAYKYEVIEAIPYNGAIMHQIGLTVAFNSDDAEMARRLNQEAAKAVKYGNISEEDALKFVTLNPAKLLHIDDKVGSIKKGKDADVVIWNDHPLSVYSKVLYTFIDGTCYFDADRDLQLRETIKTERARIIKKMIEEGNKEGREMKKPAFRVNELLHCMDDE